MKKENPTAVEWIDMRKIRFKVIVFKNNQMRKRDLIAELQTDSDGNFISQPVDFSILHRRDKSLYQEEKFQRKLSSRNFELSLLDNRIVKL